jgi:oxygen-independent coproporphyrinogen-3 oxidase
VADHWPPPASEANVIGPKPPPRHVYVHVPFCARRCSYCDFAIAVRRRVPVDEYLAALSAELALRYPPGDSDWIADTLYFGGGTPSLLGGDGVRRLVDLLRSRVTLTDGAEITIEVNPDDVDADAVAAWRSAGVTRLSLGAQSFHAEALRWMHRTHTAERIGTAVGVARAAGLHDLSLDLIFALPAVLGRSWEADLEAALALEPRHVSLYGLTIEPATAVGRWVARATVTEAPEEAYEAEYLEADRAFVAAGYEHYEVSSFARSNARSRHNAAYWRGVPYAGLGPGAHEFDGSRRRWNVRPYAEWATRALSSRDPMDEDERLTPANRVAERLYLELRTAAGTVLEESEVAVVGPWIDAGWARLQGATLSLTPTGWLRHDSLAVFLANLRSRI